MPIYAYRCSACGHELEALQKLSDPKLTDCPECHTANLSKQVTAAAFRLGGSGWYETDFKNGDKKNLASKDGNDGHTEKPDKSSTESSKDGSKESSKDSSNNSGKEAPKESTGTTNKESTTSAAPAKTPAPVPTADKTPKK